MSKQLRRVAGEQERKNFRMLPSRGCLNKKNRFFGKGSRRGGLPAAKQGGRMCVMAFLDIPDFNFAPGLFHSRNTDRHTLRNSQSLKT